MKQIGLNTLLSHADSHAPPLPLSGVGLADRIRRRATYRSRVRAAVSATAIVIAAGVLASRNSTTRPIVSSSSVPHVETAPIEREIAMLDSEAMSHARIAHAIERAEAATTQHLADELQAADDPLTRLQASREQAAAILLNQANWLATQSGKQTDAATAYRRTAVLFPDTLSGARALRHLPNGA